MAGNHLWLSYSRLGMTCLFKYVETGGYFKWHCFKELK